MLPVYLESEKVNIPRSIAVIPPPPRNGTTGSSPARQIRKESRRKVEKALAQQRRGSDSDLDDLVDSNKPPPTDIPPPVPTGNNDSDEEDQKCKMSLAEKMSLFNRPDTSADTSKGKGRFHDRRRRFERARTQPITEEDAIQAAEHAR